MVKSSAAGYFLPTDKVGHWGVLNGRDVGKDLSKFGEIAPNLPKVRHGLTCCVHVNGDGLHSWAGTGFSCA